MSEKFKKALRIAVNVGCGFEGDAEDAAELLTLITGLESRIAELEEIDKLRSESISTLNQAAGVKLIADVACGSKMFWFDKENPIVEFVDKRIVENHEFYPNRYIEIKPGVVADFTNLPYADKSFKLVVFDPPHLVQAGKTSWLRMKYGSLDANWPEMLHDGFWECMRVLDNYGVLIFKWAETQIPLSKVLNAIQADPLFGHKSGKYNNTHWLCFMKINTESGEVTNDD